MNPNLAIALAIHEGACRLIAHRPVMNRETAVEYSREAMRLIIPNLDEISFDLETGSESAKAKLQSTLNPL